MTIQASIGNWIFFFLASWGLPFTVYLILQTGAILSLRGNLRMLVMLPIPIMAFVIVVTMIAYQEQSNLWPIYLIFMPPPQNLWAISGSGKAPS